MEVSDEMHFVDLLLFVHRLPILSFICQAIVDSPSVGKYVVNVGQENYYSQYEVKLQAFNIFGKGPNSSVAIVYSAEDSKLC